MSWSVRPRTPESGRPVGCRSRWRTPEIIFQRESSQTRSTRNSSSVALCNEMNGSFETKGGAVRDRGFSVSLFFENMPGVY